MKTQLNLGDSVGVLALWLWLTVAVGPWWIGVVWLVGVTVLNAVGNALRGEEAP